MSYAACGRRGASRRERSGSTCSRSSGSSGRWSAGPGSPSGCSPTASARTPPGARRPAQHLAARFCAKEAVAKALALEAWSWQDIEVVPTAGAPEIALHGAVAARADELGVSVSISLTHTDGDRRRGRAWRWPRDACPAGSSRCPTPSSMRATDRWAIEERGIPSLELMERAGAGLARRRRRDRARRAGRRRLRQGQQRRRRARRRAAAARRRARRRASLLLADAAGADRATPQSNLERLPGARAASRSRPSALDGARASIVDALLGTGFDGAPRGAAGRRRSRRIDGARRRRVVAADVPSGVDASTGEVAGAAVRARRDGDVPRGQARAVDRPGKAHAGDVRVVDIGDPARRARSTRDVGLIDARACSTHDPAPRRRARRSSPPATCSSPAARAG